jgi:hypothetical protein
VTRRIPAPSPTTVVAWLALFFALSGSVFAGVKIAKNSVSSSQIKNHSIKGADIAKNTVGGDQIDESSLGVVPRAAAAGSASAAQTAATAGSAKWADRAYTAGVADKAGSASNADHASDSDKVGGHAASDFAAVTTVFPIALKFDANQSRVLLERDGVRLRAVCDIGAVTTSGTTATALSIYAESDVDGATLQSPKNVLDGSTGNALGPNTPETKRLAVQQSADPGQKVVRTPPSGIVLTSAGGTSVFVGATGGIRIGFAINGGVCTVSAPVVISTL